MKCRHINWEHLLNFINCDAQRCARRKALKLLIELLIGHLTFHFFFMCIQRAREQQRVQMRIWRVWSDKKKSENDSNVYGLESAHFADRHTLVFINTLA